MSEACSTTPNINALGEKITHITSASDGLRDWEALESNHDDALLFVSSFLDHSLYLGGLGGEQNFSINNGGADWSDDESIDSVVVAKRRIERMARRNG
jgi:hypothetical protein